MAGVVIGQGPRTLGGTEDKDGHREYRVVYLVQVGALEGPASALFATGLPLPGSFWNIGNDRDIWAWCTREKTASIHQEKEGDRTVYWKVECKFTTKPFYKCSDEKIEDPLFQPQKIKVNSQKKTVEAAYDRFGRPIVNSAWEPIRGPQVEFDEGSTQVKIDQNVPLHQLDLLESLRNSVNDSPLWGFPKRCVRFTDFEVTPEYYGLCYRYYKRSLTFEILVQTHDRLLLDEGGKVLSGHWDSGLGGTGNWVLDNIGGNPPDPDDPRHFIRFRDKTGEVSRVILNGFGIPAETMVGTGSGVPIGPYYTSLANGNLNNTLDRVKYWITLREDPNGTPLGWDSNLRYFPGDTVLDGTNVYLALSNINPGDYSPSSPFSPTTNWILVGAFTGVLPQPFVQKGTWKATTTYAKFDIVRPAVQSGNPGIRLVQKYPENNLLLLGIPTIF